MSDTNSEENTPAGLNENAAFNTPRKEVPESKPPVILWLGLGGLLVVALLVVFVLPTIVTEYELPLERRVDVSELVPAPPVDQTLDVSPFEEAQRSIQRKDAQDVLAQLLEIQEELTDLEVVQWAQSEFEEALTLASAGDEYYRTQEFLLAIDAYQAGREQLAELLGSVTTVFNQTLIDAETAFNAGDGQLAEEKYSLALVLEPFSDDALVGLDRSRTLEEVTTLLDQAEDQIEDGMLEQARDVLDQVIALDSYNEAAPARKKEVTDLIQEREFSSIMSAGYVFLESGSPNKAIAEFERAAAMGINSEQALAAITQTENEIANAEINDLRQLIVAAEAEEKWQSAVDNYDEVLTIDANLSFAIEGRDYAVKRERLNALLIDAIANPERLAEDDVFQQTLDVYYTGRAIEQPGELLVQQLDSLEQFLESSQVPIEIQLISDNLTDVTLLRVSSLGLFERETVSLKPGKYVAVGKRSGYREVREEFVVGFNQTPSLVIVKCDELVSSSSRR
ncbi:MAG: hypothetical protein AB8B95_04510 [Pseudohongiellaceae bacterium]